jgi:hypothetical protein
MTNYSRFFESDAPGVREGDRRAATTVYVLVGQTDYEGDTVLGVYVSRLEADAAYAQYTIEHSAFDEYDIYPLELGAAAEWRW